MNWLSLLALSVGLAMDATAVAGTRGLAVGTVERSKALRLAAVFGAVHATTPFLGWLLRDRLGHVIEAWDHWLAFVLLVGIGLKMIYEARSSNAETRGTESDPFGWRPILVLALATGIDALAAGFTLPMLHISVPVSLAVIGGTTAALSFAGVYAGRRFGAALGRRLDVFGGIVLVALGAKILVEHLSGRA